MKDELKTGYKRRSCFKASLYAECQYTAEAVLEIFASKFVVWVVLETRLVNALYCRMLLKELCHCKSVVTTALGTE